MKSVILVCVFVSTALLLHVLGSWVDMGNQRLYDTTFFDISFDHWVHGIISFLGVLTLHKLCRTELKRYSWYYCVLLLIAMGVGALHEIGEYMSVVWFDATGVGTYENNIQDMMANLLGALSGLALLWFNTQLHP